MSIVSLKDHQRHWSHTSHNIGQSKNMPAKKSITCCLLHLNAPCWFFLVIFIQLFLPFAHSSVSLNITNFAANASNNIIYEGQTIPSEDFLYRVGRSVYSKPIRLWDSSTMKLANFTAHFSFTVNRNATSFGNGFTFFLAPHNNGTTASAMSENHNVTVEFDSYIDPDLDPPTQHVLINNKPLISAVNFPWNLGLFSDLVANVVINYNATAKNLSVSWTYDEQPVLTGNSSVYYEIDLMKYLPEWVKIGFSAGTGQHTLSNTIESWNFNLNLDADQQVSHRKNKSLKKYVLVFVPVSLAVLLLGLLAWWLLRRKPKGKKRPQTEDGHQTSGWNHSHPGNRVLPIEFSYEELFVATNGFANDELLGAGGSAVVYKAELEDKGLVAVKRIFEAKKYSFGNELDIARRLNHRNLVTFIGWCQCLERNELLLVYEYMPNGSLRSHLRGKETKLPWHIRYKIAQDLVKAIQYLHQGAEPCVIHRDIKPENILLDGYFTAKLGDFGIAKLTGSTTTQSSTGGGTAGYQAPEYLQQPKASKQADMYSFGTVALELASGKKPDGDKPGALHDEIWQFHHEGHVTDAADGTLQTDFDKDQMERLLMAGLWCTHRKSSQRPNVGEVIKLLKPGAPLSRLLEVSSSESDLSEVEICSAPLQIHTPQRMMKTQKMLILSNSNNKLMKHDKTIKH